MTTTPTIQGKDLTQEAPRSARERVGGYVIVLRMIDKIRSLVSGDIGEYHYDCPLDNIFLSFKGLKWTQFKELVLDGKSDEEILTWINSNGTPKTADEIKKWSDQQEGVLYYNIPEKREWFEGECKRLGLDPVTSTLFDMLDADDKTIGKE